MSLRQAVHDAREVLAFVASVLSALVQLFRGRLPQRRRDERTQSSRSRAEPKTKRLAGFPIND
jgi:hypothetical protein